MPQKPYMFLGTLQDQLLYPNVEDGTGARSVSLCIDASGEEGFRR